MKIVHDQYGAIIEIHIDGVVYTPETLRERLHRTSQDWRALVWHAVIGPLVYALGYSWRKR